MVSAPLIALQHDLGGVAVIAVAVLPFAGLELAFEIDLGALAQILLGDLAQALVEDRDIVPFGLFAPLAGVLVAPAFAGGDAQVGDRAAVLHVADFRVGAEIADQNDLVDGTGHDASSFVAARAQCNRSAGVSARRPRARCHSRQPGRAFSTSARPTHVHVTFACFRCVKRGGAAVLHEIAANLARALRLRPQPQAARPTGRPA